MLLLILLSLLAGAGTALSPCVLPVLPALLSAGGVGGRRRPIGIVIGLGLTFTIVVVAVDRAAGGVGLSSTALRDVGIAALIGFGAALFIPGASERIERLLAPFSRLGPRTRGTGFASGLLVGGALGFVYTPCAGPILAAIVSVGARPGRTIPVALAYAVGSTVVLLALVLGGRRVFDVVRRAGRGPTLQRVLGAVLVATGVAMSVNLDVRFDQFVAQTIPDVSATAGLERSCTVLGRLHDVTGRSSQFSPCNRRPASSSTLVAASKPTTAGGMPSNLPVLGAGPEFVDTQRWYNTPGGRPLSIAGLRGHVVLIDFWTYTCINCIRTLPYLEAWDAKYRPAGLTIVGVHTPEFGFEHNAGNVAGAISQFGIHYPVVQDNDMGTWNAWGNQYWPADYLIDARGQVRYAAFGEGDYGKTENAIRSLLAESGHASLGPMAKPHDVVTPSLQATPETYLGTGGRAQGWTNGPLPGSHDYGPPPQRLGLNEFAFSGRWSIGGQPALARSGAGIDAEVHAKNVYLVLSSGGGVARGVQVLLDGHPVGPGSAGADVHGGQLTVTRQRLYALIALPTDQTHRLSLRFAPGVSGFAFTFG